MIRSELVRRTFRHRIASVQNSKCVRLRDLSGETFQGVLYEEQLLIVKAPDVFLISRIVLKSGKRSLVE